MQQVLLGALIREARNERKFTAQELADRAGISRGLLQRIEKGNLKCEIGAVFEVAAIVGIKLFEADGSALAKQLCHTKEKTGAHAKVCSQEIKKGERRLLGQKKKPLFGSGSPVKQNRLWLGRLEADNGNIMFNYGKSYLERVNAGKPAIAIYEPELPLRTGFLPLLEGLTMPGCIRDAAPDAWGRRVIINKKLGQKGASTDTADLDELTYLLESGSDRIGALDFQTVSDRVCAACCK